MNKMLILNKFDEWEIKSGINSRFWNIVCEIIKEDINLLEKSALSPANEDKSKLIYSKRDKDLIVMEILKDVLNTPDKILNRIKNQN